MNQARAVGDTNELGPVVVNRNEVSHFGLLLSRSEINALIRDTVDLKLKLAQYNSPSITRISENLLKMVDQPWILDIEMLMSPNAATVSEFEAKGAKSREHVQKLTALLSRLYLEMQEEISTRTAARQQSSILSIDLRYLKYGPDIDVNQNLEELLSQSNQDKVNVYIVGPLSRNFRMLKADRQSDYVYQFDKIRTFLSKGDQFVVIALIKQNVDAPTVKNILIGPDGVMENGENGKKVVGWAFTMPGSRLGKNKFWHSIWE